MIKNLVIKGGGVLGMAYTGALLELEKRCELKHLERIAGTSAGAIVGTLLALKYTSKEIFDISSETDFRSFEDGRLLDKMNVADRYGINPGDAFLEWITEKITRKGFKVKATFADLHKGDMLDLNVFATDLNSQCLTQFSYEKTPNVCVSEAVRASMSIPLFFDAFQFSNGIPDNHIYVDGGVVFNYPISCFDNGYENHETLGLFVGDLSDNITNNRLEYGHFIQYMKALVQSLLNAQNINIAKDKEDLDRTIIIDSCGISATNFSLTVKDKMNLFESGRKGVIDYYNKKTASQI